MKLRFSRSTLIDYGIALIFALGIWTYITLHQEQTILLHVPVRYQLPENLVLKERAPDTLILRIRGRGFDLISYLFSPSPSIEIFAPPLSTDTLITYNQIQLLRMLRLKSGIEVVNFIPDILTVSIGLGTTRKIPIEIPLQILPKDKYIVASPPRISTDSIIVRSHPNLLDTLDIWRLDTIRIEGIDESQTLSIPLQKYDPNYISISPQSIDVFVEIQPLAEYNLPDVPVVTPPYTTSRFEIRPRYLSVQLRGGVQYIENYLSSPEPFIAEIDISSIQEHRIGMLHPIVTPPENLHVLRTSPRLVQLMKIIPWDKDVLLTPKYFYPDFVNLHSREESP